jgi:hypothetical protein
VPPTQNASSVFEQTRPTHKKEKKSREHNKGKGEVIEKGNPSENEVHRIKRGSAMGRTLESPPHQAADERAANERRTEEAHLGAFCKFHLPNQSRTTGVKSNTFDLAHALMDFASELSALTSGQQCAAGSYKW